MVRAVRRFACVCGRVRVHASHDTDWDITKKSFGSSLLISQILGSLGENEMHKT